MAKGRINYLEGSLTSFVKTFFACVIGGVSGIIGSRMGTGASGDAFSQPDAILILFLSFIIAAILHDSLRKASLTFDKSQDKIFLDVLKKIIILDIGFASSGKVGNTEVFQKKIYSLNLTDEVSIIEVRGIIYYLQKIRKVLEDKQNNEFSSNVNLDTNNKTLAATTPLQSEKTPYAKHSLQNRASKLFCELAEDLGFISHEMTIQALHEQQVDQAIGIKHPIGKYLFEKGCLNRSQIATILKVQKRVDSGNS